MDYRRRGSSPDRCVGSKDLSAGDFLVSLGVRVMDYSWGQQAPQCVYVWMHGWPRWLGVIPGARPITESRVYRGFLDSLLP